MKVAGIREVKNRLSHYLRLVAEGEVVLVTDRGTVVAQLAPPPSASSGSTTDERAVLEQLAHKGALRLGRPGPLPSAQALLPPPAPIDLAELLGETRADL